MVANKILSPGNLAKDAAHHGKLYPIILASGVFDILHVGHIHLLEEAANYPKFPGQLWVGLNSDDAVRKLKGEDRPIHPFIERAAVIAAVYCVSKVFEIDDIRVAQAIRDVRPAAWFKGGDYTLETLDKDEVAAAREVGADIVLVPRIGDYSSTSILKKAGLA